MIPAVPLLAAASQGHRVTKGLDDWFTLTASWLNKTFPTAKLSYRNGCVPATQSEYVSMCLQQFVDAAVDLVFVEYAANDGYSDGSVNNGAVAAFERLLRKLLQQQRGPAVVLMEFLATDAKQKGLPFYTTGESAWVLANEPVSAAFMITRGNSSCRLPPTVEASCFQFFWLQAFRLR